MESILEIVSQNIMYNNQYDRIIKDEFISTINRISFGDKLIEQLNRSMDYVLLYNTLNEELKFIISKRKYFKQKLHGNVRRILNDYMKYRIDRLNNIIINI